MKKPTTIHEEVKAMYGKKPEENTYHIRLGVNIATLNAYGSYCDFISIPGTQKQIRIVLFKEVEAELSQNAQCSIVPNLDEQAGN